MPQIKLNQTKSNQRAVLFGASSDTKPLSHFIPGGELMSILEELWYGNVHPGELNMKKHSPYKELLALMIRHQDDLLSRLNHCLAKIFRICYTDKNRKVDVPCRRRTNR